MDKNIYMFAYGMNTNIDAMAKRCPDAEYIGVGTLKNHRFDFRYHADVTKDFGHDVHGVIWKLDDACMAIMDRVEGYPFYYTRTIEAIHSDAKTYLAWVYTMTDKTEPLRYPPESYWNQVNEGYLLTGITLDQLDDAVYRIADERARKYI